MTPEKFCVLPFIHLHLSNFGHVTPCCLNSKQLGHLSNNEISDIWAGDELTAFRSKMLAGEGDISCESCYVRERGGAESLRQKNNAKYSHLIPSIEVLDPKPIYFDIRFSNLCNLRCRTCWHGSSSSWFEDAKSTNSTAGDRPLIAVSDRASIQDQLHQYLPTVQEFYFAGGEPLIMEEHYRILELLIEAGRTDVKLRYNTNFSNLKYKNYDLFFLWSHFEDIELNVSIDETGDKFELVRKGAKFSTIIENRELLRRKAPHVNVMVTPTISVFNIYSVTEIIEQLVSSDFACYDSFNINILEVPTYYNIKILPQEEKEQICTDIATYLSSTNPPRKIYHELSRIINYMMAEDHTKHIDEFRYITKKMDQLRNEDFTRTFAEHAGLVRLIQGKEK